MVYRKVEIPATLWEQFKAGALDEEGYLDGLEEYRSDILEEANDTLEYEIEEAHDHYEEEVERIEKKYENLLEAFKNREIHPDQGQFLEVV